MTENLYDNLRKCFGKVKTAILGDRYYNMGMDVYACDLLTAEDIIKAYQKVEKERNFYKRMCDWLLIFCLVRLVMSIAALF